MNAVKILSEAEMHQLGITLAKKLRMGDIVFLQGGLGAGKTTLARGLLRGLGVEGPVKSPTYTIVEPYRVNDFNIYHFDFYRIAALQELCDMGIDDYFTHDAIVLVEWPEKASGLVPSPELICSISFLATGRKIDLRWSSSR